MILKLRHEDDGDYTLTEDSVRITVKNVSIYIIQFGSGVEVTLYPLHDDDEMAEPLERVSVLYPSKEAEQKQA